MSKIQLVSNVSNIRINNINKGHVMNYINDGGVCLVGPDCTNPLMEPDPSNDYICKEW